MPNTSVQGAAEGVATRKFNIFDLEDPIENARRMASIVSRIANDMVGGNRCKWPDKHDLYHFTPQQCEDLVWAVFHSEDMISKAREMWDQIVDHQFETSREAVSSKPIASTPAAAEAMPTVFAENRILELAREISDLLEKAPGRDFVLIQKASSAQQHRIIMGGMDGDDFKPEVGIRFRPSLSKFLDAQDRVGEALDFTRLVSNAIDSLQLGDDMKAISAGVYETEKRLCSAKELLVEAKDSLGQH